MRKISLSYNAKFIFFLLIFFALWIINRFWHFQTNQLKELLSQVSIFQAGLLYLFSYVFISFFIFFSKDLLWLLGAIIFGPFLSAILIWWAEVINAAILFGLSRRLGRGFVEEKLKIKNTEKVGKRLAELNFLWLFFLRAFPVIPYRFLDVACGLSPLPFGKYVLAVILGSPLKIFWLQYILAAVGQVALSSPKIIADYLFQHPRMFIFGLVYVLILVILALTLRGKYKRWL